MLTEVEAAVKFIINVVQEKMPHLTDEKVTMLRAKTIELLKQRYENHWYEDKPMKGSAYRCINVSKEDNLIDDVLQRAVTEIELTPASLHSIFNKGLTLWIDPNDVSCRLGKGSIFPIYKKIAEKKSKPLNLNAPEFNSTQRRSQQRPRSASPPHQLFNTEDYRPTKARSLTPPGFSSKDIGYTNNKANFNLENSNKLWDTAATTYSPVASSVNHSVNNYYNNASSNQSFYTNSTYSSQSQYTPSYSSYQSQANTEAPSYTSPQDYSYSFNQYSSYYNTGNNSYWKKNNRSYQQRQKPLWQDEQTYQRYHWSRDEDLSASAANLSLQSSYSSRQAQEAF